MTAVAEQAKLNLLFEQLPDLVSADSDLVRRGALCNAALEVGVGETLFYLRIAAGRIAALERQPSPARQVQFLLHASSEAWHKFWMPVPEPGWHDLSALTKRGAAKLDGDITPYMTHLQFFKDMLASPRRLVRETR
jgi:hypothetical protein